ncbi:MAG: hypothetical protein AAF907_10250, partial [Planctomycetota bacterium]
WLAGDEAAALRAMRTHLAAEPRDSASRRTAIDWLLTTDALDEAAEQIAILRAADPDDWVLDSFSKRLEKRRRGNADL